MIATHEFPEGDRFCKWCGALQHPQMTATCLQRAIPKSELMPEPKRRQFSCEDAEVISARLAELLKERFPLVPPADPAEAAAYC